MFKLLFVNLFYIHMFKYTKGKKGVIFSSEKKADEVLDEAHDEIEKILDEKGLCGAVVLSSRYKEGIISIAFCTHDKTVGISENFTKGFRKLVNSFEVLFKKKSDSEESKENIGLLKKVLKKLFD